MLVEDAELFSDILSLNNFINFRDIKKSFDTVIKNNISNMENPGISKNFIWIKFLDTQSCKIELQFLPFFLRF